MQNSLIDNLVKVLATMPGLGPRSARRMALHLLKNKANILIPLANNLLNLSEVIKECSLCGNFTESDICDICDNIKRDKSTICVIEEVADLWSFEKAGVYKGLYHVLGGNLSALEGRTPQTLNIDKLFKRLQDRDIKEVILATNATVNGQTTSLYIIENIDNPNIKITRLAHGMPIGGELEYLDEGTLAAALSARSTYEDV